MPLTTGNTRVWTGPQRAPIVEKAARLPHSLAGVSGKATVTMAAISLSGDFDGDGKSDIAIWTPGNVTWQITYSSTGVTHTQQFGDPGDIPVPADYDGDGKADIAVWRPGNGTWYVQRSSDGTTQSLQWGQQGDIPAPGDYDGDGKADFAVWRPSDATWYITYSSTGAKHAQAGVGQAGDIPLPGVASALAEVLVPNVTSQLQAACGSLQALSASIETEMATALGDLAGAMGAAVAPGAAIPMISAVQGQLNTGNGQWPGQIAAIITQLQALSQLTEAQL